METKKLEEYSLAKIFNDNGRGLNRLLLDYTNFNNI